jgi:hypothetical protein
MRILKVRLTAARMAVLAALLLATCLAAVAAVVMTPPTYIAKAEAVIIGPSQTDTGRPANPYMQLGQALGVIADVLISASSNDAAQKQILARGGTENYVLERPFGESEPILDVTAKAPTQAQAMTTARLVIAQLTSELVNRQDAIRAAPGTRVNLVTVISPTSASRTMKTALEYGVAVFAVGLVSSFLLTVVFDRYLRRREADQQVRTRKKLSRTDRTTRTRVAPSHASSAERGARVSPAGAPPAQPTPSPSPQPTQAHRPLPVVSVQSRPRRIPNRVSR